ncbi:ACP S-malonyltransferase [Chitinophaga pendula]|uniref:ACP S-malonyltransferase n=1 Tax=Chitinophaga TaxID=79328 RepID=UPI000BAF1E90|nr:MULTISPECIES: ACP S-malonyltransferase [Chitinophaga]ASZ12876.1 [acyl-carrier-protein] S-malonyltransferase [Chitinophaga sp. MD30]UCJ09493.1 ACP S-malonyltransferase [Chitinophaga pendula]
MKAYLFPGQGSQRRGMGEQLFDKYKQLTAAASEVLGYDIAELCSKDPQRILNQTQYTQPALYVVNAFTYLDRVETEGEPDFALGHSLGEYVALFAAGAFDFETGLKLVKKRAEIMGQIKNGGMAALIGLKINTVEKILQEHNFSSMDVANYNSAEQIVISGLREDIIAAQAPFEASGAKLYFPLNVSGAFHSRYMKEAEDNFRSFVNGFKFSPLKIPVIANATARPYTDSTLADWLTRQITSQVKWYASVSYLVHQGVTGFHEVGPGDVLTKMTDFILKNPIPASELDITPPTIRTQHKAPAVTKNTNGQPSWLPDLLPPTPKGAITIPANALGDEQFRHTYNVKYAYVAGGMFHGISSKELVVRMAKAGLLSFFGTGGLSLQEIETGINAIKAELEPDAPYGVNLWHNAADPAAEDAVVALLLQYNIRNIEAAAYVGLSNAIVHYRLKGLRRDNKGRVIPTNRILAKLSRPEVAQVFLEPAPKQIVDTLLSEGKITSEEAALSQLIPMADDICTEADSAGHTDRRMPYALFPTISRLRDELVQQYKYAVPVRIGVAGGISTPESAAASFLLGAAFILTGSVNQCTVEAGTSNVAKDLLQDMNIQDTDYVPAGDMFEYGARIQVLKKGLFFPARANKLYELYKRYDTLEQIDPKDKSQLESRYFQQPLETVFEALKAVTPAAEITKAQQQPKHKMALVFKAYFANSLKAALVGNNDAKVDFQIHTSSALGAFNQWVKNTPLKSWKNRHVDEIAVLLVESAAAYLAQFYRSVPSAVTAVAEKEEKVLNGSLV